MITLIGTGHVFDLKDAILSVFDKKQPDVLCIELDEQRYRSLLMKQQHPTQYQQSAKKLPYLYRMLAQFQENMAKKFGVNPGEEMITAMNYARNHHLPLLCIDMHAQRLFSRMIKTMTMKEKFRFFFSGIAGLFVNTKKVEREVESISENVDTYLDLIEDKFPTIKKILIDERNVFMVHKLIMINEQYDQILCIVGDGHISGMSALLSNQSIDHDIIRLQELKEMPKTETDSSSASFHIEYEQY